MKEFRLDKLDMEILEILEEDCSLTYSEVAKKVNGNMWTVRDRINLLKNRGVLEKCKGILNYNKMGFSCKALIFLNANPLKLNELVSFLRGEKNVKSLMIISGSERIIVSIVGETCIDIRNYIQKELTKFDVEIKQFNIVLEEPIK